VVRKRLAAAEVVSGFVASCSVACADEEVWKWVGNARHKEASRNRFMLGWIASLGRMGRAPLLWSFKRIGLCPRNVCF